MLATSGISGLGVLLIIAGLALVLGIGALLLARRHHLRDQRDQDEER